jgi:hypothetical protein
MSHRINSDSNHENEEHKEAVLDTNNSLDGRSVKQTNLERKNNRSQREAGDTREYYRTSVLYKIKAGPVDYIH